MTCRRPDPRAVYLGAALCAALCWPAAAASAAPGSPTPAELASARGCMSCHGLVRKQVGPGFAQIAERYRGDPAAADRLAARIRSGGVGHWGRVIMPAQTTVTQAEAGVLAAWVLSQSAPS